MLDLNDTTDQMDLTDVYKIFHLATAQYTFFSVAQGTFSKIDHIYFTSLSKYKKIDITPCILLYHNALKLELNNKNNCIKYASNWRQNHILLKHHCVIEEIREEIKSFLKVNENENSTYQNIWDTAKADLRGKFIVMSAYIKRTERS
jgi:hypothetical protein